MTVSSVSTVEMFSQSLGFPVTFTMLQPDIKTVGPGPYAVLVQLHGMYDDHRSWLHKSNLIRYVEKLPLIVVLPNGGNYCWTDVHRTLRYESLIIEDIWTYINTMFQVRQDKPWAVGGLSMGGLGALRLGLKYPQKFCSIYAHSSYIPTVSELNSWDFPFGEQAKVEMDCFLLAANANKAALPRISFDCGIEDSLLRQNRDFNAHLTKLGFAHHYAEFPGGHTWDYWDLHVQEALKQHIEVLALKAAQP
jgi:S-formylglutathione hydrolase FrmB